MTQTIEFSRILFGPLPNSLCLISYFFKTLISSIFAMLILSKALVKFAIICIFKSMPQMNDNLLSFYIYSIIIMISFMSTLVRFYLPGRPFLYQVSINLHKNVQKENLSSLVKTQNKK